MGFLAKIKIQCDEKLIPLGDLYGLFFEDLNHAADGGLYAEMIQNRSFEFCELDHPTYHALYAWEDANGQPLSEKSTSLRVLSDDFLHVQNRNYLKVNRLEETIIRNRGYNQGLYLQSGEKYRLSFFAKPDLKEQQLILQLQNAAGEVFTESVIPITEKSWRKYEVVVTMERTVTDGRLAIVFPPKTDLAIDMVSVFPVNTFKNRENGCRKDLAEKLAAMKPKFMRFPGGCLVHDGSSNAEDHDSMYRWKKTLGPVETRPTRRNNWGYNQSLGLGFFEYFQLCEDLGAKPIPVLPAGWDPHHQRAVPIAELDEWLQDALDLIAFANGEADSTWGSVRAKMGHPEPFSLEYLAIGNEEVGPEFFERYTYFHEAIRQAYPEIKLINSAGPFSAGSEYNRGWESARTHQSDLVDEHYYASPEWFLANHTRYDSFDAHGPKVFLGEYAAKSNRWWSALAEASYMIGLERNADKVALACYAPLLANIDYVNWRPDLIWFNQETVYGSVNYDVQKLFMTNQGTHNVAFEMSDFPEAEIVDDAAMTGSFGFVGDHADIEVTSLIVTDEKTGQATAYDVKTISGSERQLLDTLQMEHYKITFHFTKTGGRVDKGFQLFFGQKDEKNYYSWSLGGWQNQDCLLSSHVNGCDSVLTQSIWQVQTNQAYLCELEVNHRQLTTTINGQVFNETKELPLVIQPLYVNTVYDEEKEVFILKIVNVREDQFHFNLDNSWDKINLTQLSAEITAENSLEHPEQVTVKKEEIPSSNQAFVVEPFSVLFLEFTPKKNKK